MSEEKWWLDREAGIERCRKKGPNDNLPLTKEEEIRAWYGPEDAEPKEPEGGDE